MAFSTEAVSAAMTVHVQIQETAARNLANAMTPGFKRNVAMVESGMKSSERGSPSGGAMRVDFSAGPVLHTGNTLDLALSGEGFFTLNGPKGTLYTRAGSFRLDHNRMLTTQEGYPLIADGGEIQVPEGAGPLAISNKGDVRAGEVVLGRLKITAFDRPAKLTQAGGACFKDLGAAPREAAGYSVRQGFIESSNVDAMSELVRMMSTMRDYEACARSLKSIEESAGRLYSWAQS
jgi:flagellar basal-body rod protein FlgG